jgi:hypothetical protein
METIRVIENDTKIKHNTTYYRIERLPTHPLYVKSGVNLGGYICKESKVEDGGWVSEGVFLTRSTIKEAAVLVNSSILDREVEVFDSEISGSTSLYWATDTPGAIIKNSEISGLEGSNNNIKLIENSRIIGAWKCRNEYEIEIVDSVIIGSGTVGGKLNGVWKS